MDSTTSHDTGWFERVATASQEGIMAFRSVRAGGRIVDFEWIFVNPAAARIVGMATEDLVGRRLLEVMPGNLDDGLFERYRAVADRRAPTAFDHHYAHEGLDITVAISATPLDDGFLVTFHDRTAEARAQRELAESERRYRELVEHQAEFVCRFLPDTTIQFANEAYARYNGHTPEEMVGLRMVDLLPPERREEAMAVIRSVGPDRLSVTDEGYLIDVGGRERWQQWTTTAIVHDGAVVEIQAVGIDITARKMAERVLEAERSRFAALVEHSSDLVIVVGPDGHVAYASPSVTRQLGWEADSVATVGEVLDPATRDDDLRRILRAQRGETPFRTVLRVRTAWGDWRWLDIVGTNRVDVPTIGGYVLNGRDVSDERAALEALGERASLLALVSRVTTAFIDVEPERLDLVVSHALADLGRTLGVDRAYVFQRIGRSTRFDHVHEWVAPGIAPQIDALPVVDLSTMPATLAALESTAVVCSPDIGALGDEWRAERELLGSVGIRALLAVPLLRSGQLVGLIGFDVVDHPRPWSDQEIDLLGTAAAAMTQMYGRVEAERAVRERAEMLDLLARVSTRLIDVPAAEVDAAVDDTLADVGRTMGVDRSWVFSAGQEGDVVRNTHEWCAPGIAPQIELLGALPVAEVPRWVAELRAHRRVQIDDVDALGDEWIGEREVLGAQSIRSTLSVPMVDDGVLVGFIGFDAVVGRRAWSDLEVTVLESIAVALSQMLGRVGAEAAVRASESRFRALVAGVPDLLIRLGDDGTVLDWRASTDVDLGGGVHPVGRPLTEVTPDLARAIDAVGRSDDGVEVSTVVSVVSDAGQGRSYEARVSAADDESIVVVRDVTEQRRLQASLLHAATHDALTGLANRRLFAERLDDALRRRTPSTASRPAVLYIDLDRFKVINDSLGHDVGDQMLTALASRLVDSVRPGDVVARLGGDEFAVLCHRIPSVAEAVATAERILAAVARPVAGEGDEEHLVSASIGVVLGSDDSTAGSLMRDADAAMYRAKERGRRRVEVFTPEIHTEARERQRIQHDLGRAIERDELRVHLQPVWSMREHRWSGVEALVRWQHPERGLLGPGAFLPAADELGQLPAIGAWVIAEACRTAARWRAERSPAAELVVWVNLAEGQLADPGLVDDILDQLGAHGLGPEALGVEVTETAIVGDTAAARASCAALRAAGIQIALDDFGTGSSSLTQLSHLPLDVVKLDGSFIGPIGERARAHGLVAGIVSLVHSLGLSVVAEGVETADQLTALAGLSVDAVQGFVFARPVPAEEVPALVAAPPTGSIVPSRLPGLEV